MGPIERAFHGHRGRPLDKWLHYLPLYDRYLAPWIGRPLTMLEIGVGGGGSLEMWRTALGTQATLFGIDVNPKCAARVDPPNQVRIGSQDDPAFLARILDEMGAPDIVLDDGSHVAAHQRASFAALWPALKPGGLYIIEDLHTAYWPRFGGGYRVPESAVELGKQLVDDLHGWHHDEPAALVPRQQLGGVHFHDSMVVIEKVARAAPSARRVGEVPQ